MPLAYSCHLWQCTMCVYMQEHPLQCHFQPEMKTAHCILLVLALCAALCSAGHHCCYLKMFKDNNCHGSHDYEVGMSQCHSAEVYRYAQGIGHSYKMERVGRLLKLDVSVYEDSDCKHYMYHFDLGINTCHDIGSFNGTHTFAKLGY